jgi:Flp pilus assembly protein TadB
MAKEAAMAREIWRMASAAPAINFGGSMPQRILLAFAASGSQMDAQKYLSAALIFSLIVSFFSFLAFAVFADILLAAAASFFTFALLFLCISYYPIFQSSRLESAYASEMPLILRQAAVYISIGIPPEKSLELLSESHYLFASHLRAAVMQIKSGAPSSRALSGLSAKFASRPIKSAVSALAFAFSHGGGQEMLRSLADNLSSEALSSVRLFSSRSSLLFLAFIAASALLPAFFGIYAVLSAGILKEGISDAAVFGAYMVFFPLLDALALLLLFAMRPPALAGRRGGPSSLLGMQVSFLGMRASAPLFAGVAFFFALLSALSYLVQMPILYIPFAALFCLAIAPILQQIYRTQSQAAQMEKMLPGALFEVSYLQQTTSAEKWLEKIAEGNYGALSGIFAQCSRKVAAGAALPAVLADLAANSDSALLSRSAILISHAYSSGSHMHRALMETAQDILSTFSLISEREAALSMQKYTILFGGGVLVPIILGLVHGMASALGKFPGAQGGSTSAAMPLATSGYLLIYSLLASIAVGHSEGQRGNWPIYLAILAPLTLLLYHLSSSFSMF